MRSVINFLPSTFLCLSKQPWIHLLSYVANPTNLAPRQAKTNSRTVFSTLFDLRLLQRKSGYSRRAIITPLVPAESFLKGTSSYTTGKVSWFSKVWAQHIPGIACQAAGGSHPATGPYAAGGWRLLDGGRRASGMGSRWGKQKVWLTPGPDKMPPETTDR